MTKAILWDADGVIIKKHGYFSDRWSKEYDIPLENILKFFKGEFVPCMLGRADLKEEIAKYLPGRGVKISVDELLVWWFSGEKEVEQRILEAIQNLRGRGIKAYLATDQEKYRANYILNDMGLSKYLDKSFFSCNLGYRKCDKEFFEKVLLEIKEKPQNVLYWDDDENNIQVAKSLGINAEVYASFGDFKDKMAKVYQTNL